MTMTDTVTTLSRTIVGVDIAGYLVRDPKAAVAFYRDTLGIEPTEVDDLGRGAEFTLADGTTFGVWKTPDSHTGGFVMFAVSDIHDAIAAYRSRGVEVSDVSETPACYMAFAHDPEGNGIILHQRKLSA